MNKPTKFTLVCVGQCSPIQKLKYKYKFGKNTTK